MARQAWICWQAKRAPATEGLKPNSQWSLQRGFYTQQKLPYGSVGKLDLCHLHSMLRSKAQPLSPQASGIAISFVCDGIWTKTRLDEAAYELPNLRCELCGEQDTRQHRFLHCQHPEVRQHTRDTLTWKDMKWLMTDSSIRNRERMRPGSWLCKALPGTPAEANRLLLQRDRSMKAIQMQRCSPASPSVTAIAANHSTQLLAEPLGQLARWTPQANL